MESRTNSQTAGSAPHLPLVTLLSQALVAFTIEFDNEFEHQTPHRTTISVSKGDSSDGPWLASMVMYSNFMQFVTDKGITVAELRNRARTTRLLLDGMRRWGYILINPDPKGSGSKARTDAVLRPTAKGRRAKEVWGPLFAVIERRWLERFGEDEIARVRESLSVIVSQLDILLPDYLPILGYGLTAEVTRREKPPSHEPGRDDPAGMHLPMLLSKVLLAFAIEFERESDLSLAITANIIRVLDEKGIRLRDLPQLSGVSKEALAMSIGFLRKGRYIAVEPIPAASRTKSVRLTAKGAQAQQTYTRLLAEIEERWGTRFRRDATLNLRNSLLPLVGDGTGEASPLFKGLEPYPDGWRAAVRRPDTLPHYPMVLHRGGYPDGS